MLILTRRSGEALLIGNAITVTILQVNGKQVRLGVAAPEHICVLREELSTKSREIDTKKK